MTILLDKCMYSLGSYSFFGENVHPNDAYFLCAMNPRGSYV